MMRINKKWMIALTLFFAGGSVNVTHAQRQYYEDSPERLSRQQMSSEEFFLPSINEIYEQAKAYGLSRNWNRIVRIQPKNYRAMKLPRRAFAVGQTLSNIAVLVLDTNAVPSKGLVQHAYDAILSLNPPRKINAQLQRLRNQLEAGTLRGRNLREQVDILLDETVQEMVETAPSLRDAGMLVLGAGYFRAMYLGASTVAKYSRPNRDQLAMFRWGSIIDHFIRYFTQKANRQFKSSAEVKSFVIALKKIQRLLNKAPERISKQDISQVARALKPLFK